MNHAIELNPIFQNVRQAFKEVYDTHNTQLSAETVQQEKRDRIEALRSELQEATANFGDPGYEGRDMNRIASDMKRVNGQLDQAIEGSDNYFINLAKQVKALETAVAVLKRDVGKALEVNVDKAA